MTIYNSNDLYNKYVKEQALEAFAKDAISEETYRKIVLAHPTVLYTPNTFIRIALALLTLVAVIFSGLLMGLIFQSASRDAVIVLLIIFGVLNYIVLELLVKEKKYYNAGVDNLLMFFSVAFTVSSFLVADLPNQLLVVSGVTMFVCFFIGLRFADTFMSVLSYLSLYVFIFLVLVKMGNIAKAAAPFLMMIVSMIVYRLVKKLANKEKALFYRRCCKGVMLIALITLYVSVNFFVVKELSNQMFDMHLELHDTIPLGWLFWLFTFLIPIGYIVYGGSKKDLMMIRTGLILFAATIFTMRYYYPVMPAEIAMVTAGGLIVVGSYLSIRLLKKPRYGFNFERNKLKRKEIIDVKALIITQVTGKNNTSDRKMEFGEGNFGGGGAGGGY